MTNPILPAPERLAGTIWRIERYYKLLEQTEPGVQAPTQIIDLYLLPGPMPYLGTDRMFEKATGNAVMPVVVQTPAGPQRQQHPFTFPILLDPAAPQSLEAVFDAFNTSAMAYIAMVQEEARKQHIAAAGSIMLPPGTKR